VTTVMPRIGSRPNHSQRCAAIRPPQYGYEPPSNGDSPQGELRIACLGFPGVVADRDPSCRVRSHLRDDKAVDSAVAPSSIPGLTPPM